MFKSLSVIAIIIFLFSHTALAATFSRDLYFGLRNDPDVVQLQSFLRGLGYFTYPQNTGNFFTATLDAVKKFQISSGVQPIAGYFGPLSRAKANEMINSGVGGKSISQSATSTFYGKIRISSFSGSSEAPEGEVVEIENSDETARINMNGWTIENSFGNRLKIPQVYNLPGTANTSLDDLALPPSGTALISVGRQDRRMNFQENICTGYFDENSAFQPSVSNLCPTPDTAKLDFLDDKCLRLIEGVSSCRTPSIESLSEITSKCSEYVSANLSYAGCIKNYRSRPDFFQKKWLIWMQRSEEFFRNVHDKVILRDQFGKFVDEASY